ADAWRDVFVDARRQIFARQCFWRARERDFGFDFGAAMNCAALCRGRFEGEESFAVTAPPYAQHSARGAERPRGRVKKGIAYAQCLRLCQRKFADPRERS